MCLPPVLSFFASLRIAHEARHHVSGGGAFGADAEEVTSDSDSDGDCEDRIALQLI